MKKDKYGLYKNADNYEKCRANIDAIYINPIPYSHKDAVNYQKKYKRWKRKQKILNFFGLGKRSFTIQWP